MMLKIKTKLKKLVLILTGEVSHLKKGVKCNSEWYGNNYGGFYVFPEFLNDKSIVYSFGIGEDISFDRALIEHHNCIVFGFDPTPKSISWVRNDYSLPTSFIFNDYGIADRSGVVDFYLPKNPEHVSGSYVRQVNVNDEQTLSVEMKSLEDIVNSFRHTQIDVLKMDIEGAEYKVLDSVLNCSIPIIQILIEFHERFVENGKSETKQAIAKLNTKGYEIFGISDSFEEVSFINASFIRSQKKG